MITWVSSKNDFATNLAIRIRDERATWVFNSFLIAWHFSWLFAFDYSRDHIAVGIAWIAFQCFFIVIFCFFARSSYRLWKQLKESGTVPYETAWKWIK